MQSYLLIGEYQNDLDNLIKKHNLKVSHFEAQKIEDIRRIQKMASLSQNQNVGFVLENFDKASEEAQNAFLKSLEEPPKNVFYILLASKKDNITETIISRCEVVENLKKHDLSEDERQEILNFENMEKGEKFLYISKINDRKVALSFLQNFLIIMHKNFLKNPQKKYQKILSVTNETIKFIEKYNGNVQLHLLRFLLYN